MTSKLEARGEGERAEQSSRRRYTIIVAALLLSGGVIGGVMTVLTGGRLDADMPALGGVALAVFYLLAVGIGSWYFYRSIDEVEMRDNLIAYAVGAHFYMIVYPVWYFLWRGGLVIEPAHLPLFLATIFITLAYYLGKKSRP